jgi:hypothetical protein
MNSKLLFLSFFIVILSCKTDQKENSAQSKMEQVMAVHDEVMPKMGTINKLIAELKPLADSTEAGNKYQTAMEDLQGAHRSMMNWMQGFGTRFNSDEILNGKELSDQKKAWLLEEEVKVNQLKKDINSSIDRAQKILSEN